MIAKAESSSGGFTRQNPIVRFFSSIRLGVFWLFLILVYASIGSALPQVRGAIEMTEMQVFHHWVFALLIVLFCVTLVVATWTRVRWNVTNLGVLTVHSGLLMLTGGSLLYFWSKVEGDILLRSPRIQLINTSMPGSESVLAEVLAEREQGWTNTMPAFGGQVGFQVLDTQAGGGQPVHQALVNVRIGSGEARTVALSADSTPMVPISDKLALRLAVFPTESKFYDNELPALFYRKVGETEQHVRAMPGLPLHRERYLNEGYQLEDTVGHAVPSKRTTPELTLGGIRLPTGWFEHWRLPLKLETPELPFDIEVTGYLPYIAGTKLGAVAGGKDKNPALEVSLADPRGRDLIQRWMFASDPQNSRLPINLPVDFRWVDGPAQLSELVRPRAGAHELVIEIKDPPVSRTVAISEGQTLEIEGTPYTLNVQTLSASWPLMTPGFEGVISPVAIVEVQSADKKYQRTVVERFPELTQDIDEQGMRKKDGPYDPNLVLRYRSSPGGAILFAAGPTACNNCPVTVAVFDSAGQVRRWDLPVGVSQRIDLMGMPLDVQVASLIENARRVAMPVVEPLDTRRPGLGRQVSAIRVKFIGRGELKGWNESQWCTFSAYPMIEPQPLFVEAPDGQNYELIYSRYPRELGATLAAQRLAVKFFPGRQGVESWRSDFTAQVAGGQPTPLAVYTNQTAVIGPLTLFQSGAANDHWSYTILGVGNRRGIWPMTLGCVLITLGSLYAFYVKPVIRRRRIERALAEAESRGVLTRGAGQAARPQLARR